MSVDSPREPQRWVCQEMFLRLRHVPGRRRFRQLRSATATCPARGTPAACGTGISAGVEDAVEAVLAYSCALGGFLVLLEVLAAPASTLTRQKAIPPGLEADRGRTTRRGSCEEPVNFRRSFTSRRANNDIFYIDPHSRRGGRSCMRRCSRVRGRQKREVSTLATAQQQAVTSGTDRPAAATTNCSPPGPAPTPGACPTTQGNPGCSPTPPAEPPDTSTGTPPAPPSPCSPRPPGTTTPPTASARSPR